jgi:ribosome maturation factor RimP
MLWCAAMMRDVLLQLLEPVVESEGFELVDVEFARGGRGGLLRIYIDLAGQSAGDDGGSVSVDDCVQVSQAVSRHWKIMTPSPVSTRSRCLRRDLIAS